MAHSAETLTRRKRRSSADLRAAILAAAEMEFSRHGYAATTTAAIASRAETTEAQIFRYFPSKVELFRKAMVQPLDGHLRDFMEQFASGEGRLEDKASAYIAELTEFIGQHEQMFRSLVMAQQQKVDGIATVDALGEYFARGAAIMRERSGEGARIDPDLMVRISFAAVLGCELFGDWLYPPGKDDRAAARKAVARFVVDGLYARTQGKEGNHND